MPLTQPAANRVHVPADSEEGLFGSAAAVIIFAFRPLSGADAVRRRRTAIVHRASWANPSAWMLDDDGSRVR